MQVLSQNHQIQSLNPQETVRSARVIYYDFFASLFLFELLEKHQTLLKEQSKFLMQFSLRDEDTQAFETIIALLDDPSYHIQAEYTRLFSMPNSPISVYLSHHIDGCNGGESLVMVRQKLKELSLILNRSQIKENEDHFGILCLLMKILLQEKQDQQANEIYLKAISPMQKKIIQSLQKCNCTFYQSVGQVLEGFLMLEESFIGS